MACERVKPTYYMERTVPVAARSKAWVCGRSLPGIAFSNTAWGIDVYCFEFRLLSGSGVCVGLITLTEESYQVQCV